MADIFSDFAVQGMAGEGTMTGIRPLLQPLFSPLPDSVPETEPVSLFHISSVVTPAFVQSQSGREEFALPEEVPSEAFSFDAAPSRFPHPAPPLSFPPDITLASSVASPGVHEITFDYPPIQRYALGSVPPPTSAYTTRGVSFAGGREPGASRESLSPESLSDEMMTIRQMVPETASSQEKMPLPLVHEHNKGRGNEDTQQELFALSEQLLATRSDEPGFKQITHTIFADSSLPEEPVHEQHVIPPRVKAFSAHVTRQMTQEEQLEHVEQPATIDRQRAWAEDRLMQSIADTSFHSIREPVPQTSQPSTWPVEQRERAFGSQGAGGRTDAPITNGTVSNKPSYVSGREAPHGDVRISFIAPGRQSEALGVTSSSANTEIGGRRSETGLRSRHPSGVPVATSSAAIDWHTAGVPAAFAGEETQFSAPERGVAGDAEGTIIRVNIGRLVVRAAPSPAPAAAPSPKRGPRPALSLREYLKQRENGTR